MTAHQRLETSPVVATSDAMDNVAPGPCLYPSRSSPRGSITRARQARSLAAYLGLVVLALALHAATSLPFIRAFATGLVMPGAGFVYWSGPGGDWQVLAIALATGSLIAFAIALVLWIATGNALAPPVVWIAAAIGAAALARFAEPSQLQAQPGAIAFVAAAAALFMAAAYVSDQLSKHVGQRRRAQLNIHIGTRTVTGPIAAHPSRRTTNELTQDDLKLMRLVLDRALQPVDAFDGFEWRDQFQSAAVRYQLCFASLALSMAQHVHMPAFQGYLTTAQENLIAKQLDHRVWRYWQFENLWGNLCSDPNPVCRDNIMYSAFLALQIAAHYAASGRRRFDEDDSLTLKQGDGTRFTYSTAELVSVLQNQHASASFRFLACEPNWIYPSCNFMSAAAIRSYDAIDGNNIWAELQPALRHRLETEFVTAGGRLVPVRSSRTGFAPPAVGGAPMEAFPCYLLNALWPDIADRHWLAMRSDIKDGDWRKAVWPVDPGNYRWSRAAGYAAIAAAAVELGDGDVAQALLQRLDGDHPVQCDADVAHRPGMSLWAHAVELLARCGTTNGFQSLVTKPHATNKAGPYIKSAHYPDVLVASATTDGARLNAILYPGRDPGVTTVTIAGLHPDGRYDVHGDQPRRFQAKATGEATLSVHLGGRTELILMPST